MLKGREAIACDAVGALDAVAATGTIGREEGWLHSPGSLLCDVRLISAARKPRRRARAGRASEG